MGRPLEYTKEVGDRICEAIATSSQGLRRICEPVDLPSPSTIYKWLIEVPEFQEQYARAREAQGHFIADEILEIADDGTNDLMTVHKGDASYEMENKEVTNRSKLRVEARKWLAGKLAPKKYGDKIDINQKNTNVNYNSVPLSKEEINQISNDLEKEF